MWTIVERKENADHIVLGGKNARLFALEFPFVVRVLFDRNLVWIE